MADAFAKGASEAGNIVMRFDTAHKHIQGCRACDNCFSKENKACIFNDDFNELASLMAESDVIVFCTPLYWYSFPAQIKAAIDKFYSFIIGKKDVPIKECMLLSCGELEDPHVFDGIVRSFELIAQDRGWKNRGHYLVNSVNEKGAILNTEHLQKIYNLGKDYDSPIEFLENNRSKFDCDRDNRYIIQYANLFHNELERYSYNFGFQYGVVGYAC